MSKVESMQVVNPSGIADEAAHIVLEGAWKYFVLAPLEELGKHVLSFWVKGKTSGDMTVNYGGEQHEVSVTTDWQKVVFKFNAESLTNIWIYFSGTEYWMYNTQLELGDVATDYSKNPQEVEDEFKQGIADTKEQVEQYRKETSAEILITQEQITQSVTGLEERISKDYYTKTETSSIIAQTQNGILQTVSANITETRTYADTVASTAQSNAISAASTDATNKANAAQANAINDTTNRLKSYSTTTQMNSAIDQRANSITSTVNQQITETKTYADNAVKTATTDLQTKITQTQNSILSTVSATYTTKNEVNQSISSAEQMANKISWLVQNGTSASNFTLTSRMAELTASTISLNGNVKVNGSMIVDGAITASKIAANAITADKISVTSLQAISAKIGGFTIGSNYIANGTSSLAGATTSVYLGTSGISCGTKFKVTNAGVVTCSDIQATGGKIGGFTIGASYLANGTTSLGSGSSSVYLGTSGISCGTKFKVTNAGVVTCSDIQATGGKIGGFTIGSASLYSGKSGLTSSSTGVYIGTDGISIGGSTPALKVTSSGELTIGYKGTIEFKDGVYNMALSGTKLTFKGGSWTTTITSSAITIGETSISGSAFKCGDDYNYTNISQSGITIKDLTKTTTIKGTNITTETVKITQTSTSSDALTVSGKSTFEKDVTMKTKIQLGTSSTSSLIGFFGKDPIARKSIAKISNPSVSTTAKAVAEKLNELLTALGSGSGCYGLIGH